MCDGKRIYKTRAIANRATRAPHFKASPGRPLLPYPCRDREGYHVGHRSRGHRRLTRTVLSQMNPPDMATIEARARVIRQQQQSPGWVDWPREWAAQRERFADYADRLATKRALNLRWRLNAQSFRAWVLGFLL